MEKETLNKPLEEEEIFEALTGLNADKSPGPYGITKEWFKRFWINIKAPYLNCIQKIQTNGELTEMQKRGAIKISHKKGDRTHIKNYRPITLLNVDLKIITKALSERLKSILSSLVHPNQTCIPGRHIENNIHITQDIIDYSNS